jgi:AraC family transcriptional regulator
MNYHQRLNKAIDLIGQHLDEEISLEMLSDQVFISKFHFHRLFTALTGLSLQQYVKWLRLKRAAHQLIVHKDQAIINIAIGAGYDSHEAFTRAFKKACGFTPNEYRRGNTWVHWEQAPYQSLTQDKINMKVDIKNSEAIKLAVIEHRGDPKLVANTVNKLITWAKAQSINLKPKAGEAFAFAYDDPKTTTAAEFRVDFGIKVPANFKIDGMLEKPIPAGRYAIAMHKGSHSNLAETVYALYRWVADQGQELANLPCIFCYHNFEHEVAETELLTECWLLLK